jgi:hypothetical protein
MRNTFRGGVSDSERTKPPIGPGKIPGFRNTLLLPISIGSSEGVVGPTGE